MSARAETADLLDRIDEFYRDYYQGQIAELADKYPSEKQSLYVEYKDVYQAFNKERVSQDHDGFRDNVIDRHEQSKQYLEEALRLYDLPVDRDLGGAHVRLTDSNEYIDRLGVGDLKAEHVGEFIALRCQIGKVAERQPKIEEAAFECGRCGTLTCITQPDHDFDEPHECQGCERQGPFHLNENQTEFRDLRKLKLEAPPEKQSNGELIAYCLDDLADAADGQLHNKAGSRVTVLGTLKTDMSDVLGRGQNEPVPDEYFKPEAFVWDEDVNDDIDLDEKREGAEKTLREEVREWANRDDAVDLFRWNIHPSLVPTEGWDKGTEMAAVWLFAAPRLDPPGGDTVRGDIHMLGVSDPGMNKSQFADKLAELAPKALMKDSEGMSSDVALTAAATRGGFGDDSWTIEPGAGPKANGGKLILDEIDKGPDGFLNGMHSLLEGDQTLHVEKAGQEATLATRFGFLALGNPTNGSGGNDGRFDPYEPIPEQIDLHEALMSRFDLIWTMQDKPDEEADREIAEGVLDSIDETARLDYGELESSDTETVSGEIPRMVMKAWVKLARKEIHPTLSEEAKEILADYYVETRQLNGEDSDKTPVTARTLPAGWRISAAYARMGLSEEVTASHAERAVSLSKIVVGENFDPETGDFDSNRTTESPSSQTGRVKAIVEAAQEPAEVSEIMAETGLDEDTVTHRVDKLKEKGHMYSPELDKFEATIRPSEVGQ